MRLIFGRKGLSLGMKLIILFKDVIIREIEGPNLSKMGSRERTQAMSGYFRELRDGEKLAEKLTDLTAVCLDKAGDWTGDFFLI